MRLHRATIGLLTLLVAPAAAQTPTTVTLDQALRYAAEHQIKALKVISDSELMVRQMKGIYKVRHPELRKLYDEAQQLVRRLEHFEIRHALREHNKTADRLANQAMDRGQR